jgi:hypothetical protein
MWNARSSSRSVGASANAFAIVRRFCSRARIRVVISSLATVDLAGRLCDLEEAPWERRLGALVKAGDARRLGQLLAGWLTPFGIESKTVRISDEETAKGYHREDFHDAWTRYVPDYSPASATENVTNDTSQAGQGAAADSGHVTEGACDVSENARERLGDKDCDVCDVSHAQSERETASEEHETDGQASLQDRATSEPRVPEKAVAFLNSLLRAKPRPRMAAIRKG